MGISTFELGITEAAAVQDFLAEPSQELFGPVFRLYAPRLLRFFELRGCDRELAEDLTQDTMLAAYRRAGFARDHANFRAYVYGIARNHHLMHLRRLGRSGDRVELEAIGDTLVSALPDLFARSMLAQSLQRLEVISRQILTLRYLDGLEYHEIAEVLGMPTGTVQWKVFDAKKKLAEWMKQR